MRKHYSKTHSTLKTLNICLAAAIVLLSLGDPSLAEEQDKSVLRIKESVRQLNKRWEETKREYKDRFKAEMKPIEEKIKELNNTLDYGDPQRRGEINEEMKEMKRLREEVRKNFHETTVTSLVDISAMQKHFKNAKDDTKD